MMKRPGFLSRLRGNTQGAMVIETAIVAPVLVLMSLGAYQISGIVARQTELQSAAAEAAAIALAAAPDTVAKRDTLEQVIEASTGLATDKVQVSYAYRCGETTAFVTSNSSCGTATYMSSYVKIDLTDRYTPAWTRFGVGSPIDYSVTRYVMYSQDEV
jgi:Flp pilus assembly protein TadG